MMRGRLFMVGALTALGYGAPLAQESETTVEHGAAVYQALCAHCHDPAPEGTALPERPGVEQLELKYGGELSPYIKERPDLGNFEVLRVFLRQGSGSMPPFRHTEITDGDIEALAAYLRHTASD